MYKVFLNDSFLLVTPTQPEEKDIVIKSFHSSEQINDWIELASTNKHPVKWAFVTEHPQQTWSSLATYLPIIEAAGGLVRNANGKYLFIYRRQRWDLPKGKMDAGETPEQTAVREVEEETGLSPLKMIKFLTHTYHIYKIKESFTLKRTHWYLMEYHESKLPVPQITEDIERAEWMTIEELFRVQEPVFGTVKDVVETVKM